MDNNSVGDTLKAKNMMLVDLTKMFGTGNEPSTPEEFEAMFPEAYYPYNEVTLLSMSVNEVVKQGKNLINIPDGQATSQMYYNVELPRDVRITVSSKIARSDGGLSRIRLDYKMDEEWKYCAGNSVVSGLSYVTAVIPREANNTRIAFQFLDNISGTLAYKDTQIELGLKPTAYMPYKELAFSTIPQAILDLPGYGWSIGDACNYVNLENKKYIQRVEHKIIIPTSVKTWGDYFVTMADIKFISHNGVASNYMVSQSVPQASNEIMLNMGYTQIILNNVDFQSSDNWLEYLTKNPIDLYYEIDPLVTDLSDIIPEGFLEALEVEAGGSLTFQNSNGDGYKVPVPNTVEYAVKLSEVTE